jgi:hypothetical protein
MVSTLLNYSDNHKQHFFQIKMKACARIRGLPRSEKKIKIA